MMDIELTGVREYAEGRPVRLTQNQDGRLIIQAENEGGCNCTQVDLEDLIKDLNTMTELARIMSRNR